LHDEGHSAADWGIGDSVELLLRVQSSLVEPCCPLLVLVSDYFEL